MTLEQRVADLEKRCEKQSRALEDLRKFINSHVGNTDARKNHLTKKEKGYLLVVAKKTSPPRKRIIRKG